MVYVVFPDQRNNAGCGESTVVRYVARWLGLYVVEYNCHDLMVTDRQSVALAQAFKTARRFVFKIFGMIRTIIVPETLL